jgi:HEAT repeat protein
MNASTDLANLERSLTTEPDWRKRAQAVYELGEREEQQALNLLARALRDENMHVAEAAAHHMTDGGVDAIPPLACRTGSGR